MTTTERLAALVSEIETDIWQFPTLTREEQIAVACVLVRLDLLLQTGLTTFHDAKDVLGPQWWHAVKKCRDMHQPR